MVGLFLNMSVPKGLVNTICNYLNVIIDITPVVVIDINSGDKLERLLQRDIEYRHLPWNGNWLDYTISIEKNLQDIDTLIIFGNLLYDTYNNKNTSLVDDFEKELANGNFDYKANFNTTRVAMQRYLVCKHFIDKKIIYICLDPTECVLTERFHTGTAVYLLKKDNFLYLPSYEHYLFKNGKNPEKTLDFTFYGTALTPDRRYLLDLDFNIPNSDVGIVTSKKANYISQKEYHDKLARSKFTLIIPSYDTTTFSIIRFFEAVANHCLPLILNTVDLTDLKNTFPDIYEIAKDLVVNNLHLDFDYKGILEKLYNTETIKNFSNLEYIKSEWRKVL